MGQSEIREIVNNLILTKGSFSSGDISAATGLSRQAVHRYLRQLVASGRIVLEGKGRGARYRSRASVFHAHLTRTAGLAEDSVWDDARAALPRLAEFKNAAAIVAHAFTEMLNNAIDHSGSSAIDVEVEVEVDARLARFIVSDEGVGAFELEANGLLWIVDNARHDQSISERPSRAGTTVRFETSLVETRTLEDIYAPYTHDFEFDSSRVVVKLFEHGVRFVSRSEAKRLLAGLERFRHVILDFAGVEGIGQGFADEVFRVWARRHAETHVRAENMTVPVTFMVERARRAATSAT